MEGKIVKSTTQQGLVDYSAKLDLSDISFDEAFNGFCLQKLVCEIAKSRVSEGLDLSQSAIRNLRFENGRIEIVYSKETLKKIRSGDYILPIDKKTNLVRIDARDAKGRIREHGKLRTVNQTNKLVNCITSAAFLICAAETEERLRRLQESLDHLIKHIEAERTGELRGIYNGLRKTLDSPASDSRRKELLHWSRELDKMEGRFFETCRLKLDEIEDPEDIGVLKSIFSLQSTAETELKSKLSGVYEDFRSLMFASSLHEIVLAEVCEKQRLNQMYKIRSDHLSRIKSLYCEKLSYLSLEISEELDQLFKHIEKSTEFGLAELQFDPVRGRVDAK
jgi:hypothetical protein